MRGFEGNLVGVSPFNIRRVYGANFDILCHCSKNLSTIPSIFTVLAENDVYFNLLTLLCMGFLMDVKCMGGE